MKKIISVLLSFVMMIAMSVSITALSSDDISLATSQLNKLLNSFRSAIKSGDSYLSFKEYYLTEGTGKKTYYALYELLAYNTNDIGSFKFGRYNESYITLDLVTDAGYITGVNIYYDKKYVDENGKCNTELLNEDKKLVSERYRQALSVVKKGMTDTEKALALYDYLLTITNYPESIGAHGTDIYPDDSYKAYGLLRDGFSTCLAYAKLYAILLNESGIPAVTVGSDTINHEWVMVCIDGEWYHCDPTWDDFLSDYGLTLFYDPNDDPYDYGAVSHQYFLKSDEEFLELEHPDWEISFTLNPDGMLTTPESGPSGRFDDKFFSYNNAEFLCDTAMCYINGYWYFCDNNTNSVVRTKIDGEPEFLPLPDGDHEYIRYSFPYGNDLYVSSDYSVYRMDTVSDKFEKIFALTPPESENEEYTVYSEMSILYDELKLTTASFTYADDEDEELFRDIRISSETYPMSEVQNMETVVNTSDEVLSAERSFSGDSDISDPEIRKIVSDSVPQPVRPVDTNAAQIRSSATVYIIIGAVVLCIAAAVVIAALIINKQR